MTESLKILPAVVAASLMLLCLKVPGLWSEVQAELTGVRMAQAAPTEEDTHESEPEHADDQGHEDDNHEDSEALAKEDGTSFEDGEASLFASPSFMSESEIEVLQSLAARRDVLDERSRDLDLREQLLVATERRVDEKIGELKTIEERIEALLDSRDSEEEAQLASLVKMYETMKAKDAARIFEKLDTDILLDVAGRMKEQKMAAIMAAMDPGTAQELTVMLAKRLELPAAEGMEAKDESDDNQGPENSQG